MEASEGAFLDHIFKHGCTLRQGVGVRICSLVWIFPPRKNVTNVVANVIMMNRTINIMRSSNSRNDYHTFTLHIHTERFFFAHSNFAVVIINHIIFTWSVPEAELNALVFKLQTSCVVLKYSWNIRLEMDKREEAWTVSLANTLIRSLKKFAIFFYNVYFIYKTCGYIWMTVG